MKKGMIYKIIEVASIVFLSVMFLLVVLQVVMRYIFQAPLTWSEELARYSMIWMVFTGCVIAMKSR